MTTTSASAPERVPPLGSATSARAALVRGELTSRALVEACLRRIADLDPVVNAVVTLDADGALRAADAADAARARGAPPRPLHGIPFTVKDAIATAGMRTTAGAEELRDHVPAQDAVAVARIRAAGGILLGKTNLPPWSGDIQTSNALFGTTRNPWDPARTAGGSSGGSAAAVACGMTGFDLGSDLGGSLRTPAHFCGVLSHRPSRGIVSQHGHLARPDRAGGGAGPAGFAVGLGDAELNVLGPVARSVADLRLVLGVIAGPDPGAEAWSVRLPPPRHADPRAYRVCLWLDDEAARYDPGVREAIEDAAAALAASGVRVVRDRPAVDAAESRAVCAELIAAAVRPAGADHARWLENVARADRLRAGWRSWFARYDAVLCPVAGVAAFPHDLEGDLGDRAIEVAGERVSHRALAHTWNAPAGVAGLPSTVVPVGRTAAGLPVGAQVVGPPSEDLTALAVAELLETATGGFVPPPLA